MSLFGRTPKSKAPVAAQTVVAEPPESAIATGASPESLEGLDFLDFGCSSGGSADFAKARFHAARGVGIDISPAKVEAAKKAGINAILGDATNLQLQNRSVRFVTMIHFLEHLPGQREAQKSIQSASMVAKQFIYIRLPFFDADAQLFDLGYKFHFADWSGHTLHLGMLQIDNILRRTPRALEWTFYGRGPVEDLSHPSIVPLDAPINSALGSSPKASGKLGFRAFQELAVLIRVEKSEPYEWARNRVVADHHVLYERSAAS